MRNSHKTILLWGVLFLMFYVVYSIVVGARGDRSTAAFSDFLDAVDTGKVSYVSIHDGNRFDWDEPAGKKTTIGIVSDGVIETMRAHHTRFSVANDANAPWQLTLLSWLPFVLSLATLVFFFRHLRSAGRTTQGLRLKWSVDDCVEAAVGYLRSQRYMEAMVALAIAARAGGKDDPRVRLLLARLHADQGEKDKAIAELKSLLHLAPENPEARELLERLEGGGAHPA